MPQIVSSPARTGARIVPAAGPVPQRPRPSLFGTIGQDAPAGLVVFLVALPLCLGISLASGAPLLAGVVAGIVGGVLVSWLSGSQLSVSGPAAGLTVVMLSAIATLGSFPAVLAATAVAGVMQLLLGAARAGIIALYFPAAVIRGMLAAIGIILILKQLPHFFGADTDYFEDMKFLQLNGQNTFSAIGAAAGALSPGSVLVGAVSLALLLLWDSAPLRRQGWVRLVPGALVAVVAAVGLNQLLHALAPAWQVRPEHLVTLPVVSSLGQLVGAMSFPDFGALRHPATYGVNPMVDGAEFALLRAALAAGLPALAICRGLQVTNVVLGGTLHQHLDELGLACDHGRPAADAGSSLVAVTSGSRLAQALGTTEVRSVCYHHQAVDQLGRDLVVTARTSDGTVEGLELPDARGWFVAVQWHPELAAVDDLVNQALFDSFVAVCTAARVGRHS